MRVKRGLVVSSLFASLAALGAIAFLAFFTGGDDAVLADDRSGGAPIADPTSLADPKARSGAEVQDAGGSPVDLLYAGGASVSGLVLLASLLLFRVEVRAEKAAQKVRADRNQYYRDLRSYNRQLKGPPRANT